jgi:hypothetical protein
MGSGRVVENYGKLSGFHDPRGSLWVLYMVEQVLMICKVAAGGCARQLPCEIVRFEVAGGGGREGWQGILGQMRRRNSAASRATWRWHRHNVPPPKHEGWFGCDPR